MNEIGTRRAWKALQISGPGGDSFNGVQLFEALRRATDLLENEDLGDVEVETMGYVTGRIATAAECLFDARNAIRRANGRPEVQVD